ncbi:MAG: 50S ribosomal protein L32 [Chloroflexi bacterium]|nr:50S ribosomal protein L32 [Chloroflexota bacterium]
MTPQPKRRHSKSRTRQRRAHDGLSAVKIVRCKSCRQMRLAHRVCPNCGVYAGRQVLSVEENA